VAVAVAEETLQQEAMVLAQQAEQVVQVAVEVEALDLMALIMAQVALAELEQFMFIIKKGS
jgi:hypothetical protein